MLQKKIAVVGLAQSNIGGAEKNIASLIEALNQQNIVPTYVSNDFPNFEQFFGKKLQFEKAQLALKVQKFSLYKFWIEKISFSHALDAFDFVFNMTGNPILVKNGMLYLWRDHNYDLAELDKNPPKRDLLHLFYYKFFRALVLPQINHRYQQRSQKDVKVATISGYMQQIVREYSKVESTVIYPPATIDPKPVQNNNKEVCYLAPFDKEKNQIRIIEIATKLPDFTFHLIGSTTLDENGCYQKCVSLAKEKKLENVKFYPNYPFAKLSDLLKSCTFFLNPETKSDWSIVTVEAIGSGLIPVVHTSGSLPEIVPFPDLRYTDHAEIPDLLRSLSEKDLSEIRRKLREHIQQFSEEHFKKAMLALMPEKDAE